MKNGDSGSKKSSKISKTAGISVMALTMINVTAVVSLRGLPAEAEYGLGSIFYYLFAAIVFLIPVSLLSAELAASFPEKGGVYRWVGEAYGQRAGFLAIWLQWIQNTIWFPTVLTFAAVSLVYIGANADGSDVALASNNIFVAIVCLVVYWGATLINLKGMKASAKVSKIGGMIGTIIPAGILILCGIIWLIMGKPLQLDTNIDTLIPDLGNVNNLVLASSIFLFFAGMEMSSVHVTEIDNPKKNYPKAIFAAALICVVVFVFGTLAIGFVLPESQINLTQSLLVTFDKYMEAYHLGFLSHVIALALVIGVLAGVSTWIGGPSKGLLAVGKHGLLPPKFQKVNKHGVQQNILIIQGVIVTILILLFVFMPSVQSVYQILSQLTTVLYLSMYVLMFLAAMKLRKKYPNLKRTFTVPGGNVGIYIWGVVGVLAAVLAFVLSFFPPGQIEVGSKTVWYVVLIVGYFIFMGLPLIVYQCRKPSWDTADDTIEPFLWQNAKVQSLAEGKGIDPGMVVTVDGTIEKKEEKEEEHKFGHHEAAQTSAKTADSTDTKNTSTTNTTDKTTSNSTDTTKESK